MKKLLMGLIVLLLIGSLLKGLLPSNQSSTVIVNNGTGQIYKDVQYSITNSGDAVVANMYDVSGSNNSVGNVINSYGEEHGVISVTSLLEFLKSVLDLLMIWK